MKIEKLTPLAKRFWLRFQERMVGWGARDFPREAEVAAAISNSLKEQVLVSGTAPTYDNTVGFLENVDLEYSRILGDFHGLNGLVRNSRLAGFEAEIAKIEEREDRKELEDDRWARRVRWLRREAGLLSPQKRKLLEDYYQGYKNSGAYLPLKTRQKLATLNAKLSQLELRYTKALEKEKRYVFFRSEDALRGLGGDEIKQARELSLSLGRQDWALRLDPTICQDVARRMEDRRSKLKLTKVAFSRGGRLKGIAVEMAKVRLEIARVLGRKSWTHLKLSEGNAKRPERVWQTFEKCLPSIHKMAEGDIRLAEKSGWQKKVMRDYDIWSFLPAGAAVPSYNPERVLVGGCFRAGGKLFGLRFEKLEAAKSYHPDVQTYVVSRGKKTLGFLLVDFWQREGKDNGAWALTWEGGRRDGNFPVVSICFNFARSGKCDFSGVSTIFHEFGHALHAFFTGELPPSHAGLECANDFVETPSQLAEFWAYDKDLYENYRSETSPTLDEVRKVDPGTGLTYLASVISAGADLLWHGEDAGRISSCDYVDKKANKILSGGVNPVSPRYKSSYFEHIFNCGYDAAYYSYLWCELRAGQIHSWVRENGGLSRSTGKELLRHVYAAGGDRKNAGAAEMWSKRKPKLIFEVR